MSDQHTSSIRRPRLLRTLSTETSLTLIETAPEFRRGVRETTGLFGDIATLGRIEVQSMIAQSRRDAEIDELEAEIEFNQRVTALRDSLPDMSDEQWEALLASRRR